MAIFEKNKDGMQRWSGVSSVVASKLFFEHDIYNSLSLLWPWLIGAAIAALTPAITFENKPAGIFISFLFLICSVILCIIYDNVKKQNKDYCSFLFQGWALGADDATFFYVSSKEPGMFPVTWSISIDKVTRAEVCKTVDYTPSRHYADIVRTSSKSDSYVVSDYEYQAFLFSSDGRRLPIHYVNANKDECATLVHQINSFLAGRAKSATDNASGQDGFSL